MIALPLATHFLVTGKVYYTGNFTSPLFRRGSNLLTGGLHYHEKKTDCAAKLEKFKAEYSNVLSEDDFIEYAKECVKDAFIKYRSLFATDANLARTRAAFRACKVFDVLHLKTGPSHESLERMVDELANFGYPEFNDEFLQCMKDEIPLVLKLVTETKYNFEGDNAAKEAKMYMNRIKDRARAARKRATLHNIDDYLRHKESGGDTDLFENVGRMDGDVVYTNIEAAVHAAGKNNDNIEG